MLVWLPIVLIFDKLLVISAREGLSGIPGQPTTCPRDYKSGKFDRCNSHKLNWPLHVLAWNMKAQRFHPICRSTCLSIRNECSNASPVPPSSTWMEWRKMTSKLDDIRICTRFFLAKRCKRSYQIPFMECSAPHEFSAPQRNCTFMNWNSSFDNGPPRR